MTTWQRLFDATSAFEHSVTVCGTAVVVLALITASVLVRVLKKSGRIAPATFHELLARTRSWYVLSAAMILPILLGAFWVWIFFLLLSLFCFREYAAATKLSESRSAVVSVLISTLVAYFAVLDNWFSLFLTAVPLGFCFIAVVELLADEPVGYLRRVAVAVFGFALVGSSLGHLAFFGNDELFRPILIWILLSTELNDVFAYISGKSFGKRKLAPKTSPNKTWGGSIGAVVLTTTLSAVVAHFVFRGTTIDQPVHLVTTGLIISVLGQCGDLVVSSIKRDVGVKDMAATIPGHGGLMDRFDSLLLVAPVLFHYINFFKEDRIGAGQATCILTGF